MDPQRQRFVGLYTYVLADDSVGTALIITKQQIKNGGKDKDDNDHSNWTYSITGDNTE